MSKILGIDGKPLVGPKTIKVGEYEFLIDVLESQPMLLLMTLIAIDPTPLQEKILTDIELSISDSNGKMIFPRPKVEEA